MLAYSAWLTLLAAQVWLVRTGRRALHKRLGIGALFLLPAMLLFGTATAYYGVANNPYMPDKWIAWLSVNYTNTFGSGALIAAGLLMRHNPAAHKRLMLMGTIGMTEPGFSRIWLDPLSTRLGDGYLQQYISTYIGTFVLVLAVGAYDVATRRRLHPAYIASALWIFANEALAVWLFYQPWWLTLMKASTGHKI